MTVKFVLGFYGLNTSIDEVLAEVQFWRRRNLTPNTSWDHVEVANEQDKDAYIAAQNRYLCAAWTPNQDYEDREENKKIMAEAEAEMKRLRIN